MTITRSLTRPLTSCLTQAVTDATVSGFNPAVLFAGGVTGVWYDPSDLSTLFSDSAGTTAAVVDGPVGKMLDKSGNGNHATQATSGFRPTLRSSGGLFWLELDGLDDFMSASGGAGTATLTAVQAVMWTSMAASVFSLGNSTTSGGLSLFKSSGDAIAVQYGSGAATANVLPGVTAAASTPYVIGGDTTGTVVRAFVNLATPVSSSAITNPVGTASFNIGATAGGSGKITGRMYGMMLVGAQLSTVQRNSLVRFLAGKSGASI